MCSPRQLDVLGELPCDLALPIPFLVTANTHSASPLEIIKTTGNGIQESSNTQLRLDHMPEIVPVAREVVSEMEKNL